MKKLNYLILAATAAVAFSVQGQSTLISLTQMDGSWDWGNTEWNALSTLGVVNNTANLAAVNSILTGTYVYQAAGSSTANGIYNNPAGYADVIFSVDGGTLSQLQTLTILSSRSYSSSTTVTLDYSNDGGLVWNNVLSTTTGALGWNDVGTGGTATETINLNFGGVTGNAFRLGVNGNQISLHTLSLTVSPVPEPSTLALAGLGGVGMFFALRRRK